MLAIAMLLGAAGCDRETRRFRDAPPQGGEPAVRLSALQPGVPSPDPDVSPYTENNAYAINEGKLLYEAFNCVGCHAHGGGGMGPALMDDRWIYGSDPENIYRTIMEGRPNGMPSFRGRIPPDRVWWIVSYVRSLSGLTPKLARTNRDDHMMYGKPPARKKGAETPRSERHP
ncbi:MAG TPA: c-type cytochrome [Longimicrobiales bacterium]